MGSQQHKDKRFVTENHDNLEQHMFHIKLLYTQCIPTRHKTSSQKWFNVGPSSKTVGQRYTSNGSMYRAGWCLFKKDQLLLLSDYGRRLRLMLLHDNLQ